LDWRRKSREVRRQTGRTVGIGIAVNETKRFRRRPATAAATQDDPGLEMGGNAKPGLCLQARRVDCEPVSMGVEKVFVPRARMTAWPGRVPTADRAGAAKSLEVKKEKKLLVKERTGGTLGPDKVCIKLAVNDCSIIALASHGLENLKMPERKRRKHPLTRTPHNSPG